MMPRMIIGLLHSLKTKIQIAVPLREEMMAVHLVLISMAGLKLFPLATTHPMMVEVHGHNMAIGRKY